MNNLSSEKRSRDPGGSSQNEIPSFWILTSDFWILLVFLGIHPAADMDDLAGNIVGGL